MPWGDFIGGNCPGDLFRGSFSGAIVWGPKVRVVVVQGGLFRGNCLGDKSPGDCPGRNVMGEVAQGGNCH